jgi:hypothetical protein
MTHHETNCEQTTMFGQRKPIAKIFINYRRDDTRWVAGRLIDALRGYFGDDRVFRDVEGIAGGVEFGDVINQTMQLSDAVIVLIGPDWLTATNHKGERRLDDPDDWVSREIDGALRKDVPVYPVLIENTPMPCKDELPDALKPLVDRNAMSISDLRFENDVIRLAKTIAIDIPGSAAERKLDAVRLLVSILLLAAVVFTTGIVTVDAPKVDNKSWWDFTNTSWWDTSTETAGKTVPLSFMESGITYVAIMISSILLLVFAPLVDESRRPYMYASGLVGILGTGFFFALMRPLAPAVEPVGMFFGSTVIATAMFALMNLSGFKPK